MRIIKFIKQIFKKEVIWDRLTRSQDLCKQSIFILIEIGILTSIVSDKYLLLTGTIPIYYFNNF
jgi:hypothetical protein